MTPNKERIAYKVKWLFIQEDPRLASPDFRKAMSLRDKADLVTNMLLVAHRMELYGY